jgi:predicted RNase H-like HicB family nuclease
MKQRYHTIIKPEPNGWFVGWVEEIPGTISQGRSLDECRQNLRDSLELVLETHRDEARLCLDGNCIQETIEIEIGTDDDPAALRGDGLPTVEEVGRPAGPQPRRRIAAATHANTVAASATGMLQPIA